MRVASQIWQVVFASQTLQVFCLAFRKKAQYVVVLAPLHLWIPSQKIFKLSQTEKTQQNKQWNSAFENQEL
jgi:hypothetical protein